jgi:hypothetical protein
VACIEEDGATVCDGDGHLAGKAGGRVDVVLAVPQVYRHGDACSRNPHGRVGQGHVLDGAVAALLHGVGQGDGRPGRALGSVRKSGGEAVAAAGWGPCSGSGHRPAQLPQHGADNLQELNPSSGGRLLSSRMASGRAVGPSPPGAQ